jgi:hypothetical protein
MAQPATRSFGRRTCHVYLRPTVAMRTTDGLEKVPNKTLKGENDMKTTCTVNLFAAALLGALALTTAAHAADSALAKATAGQGKKPNIVYILVDNWGWGDIGVQGSTVPTPRIDALAAQGMRLTNFNVQNQCTPTRSALHTGRLPIRSGTQKVAAPGEPDGLAPWEYTIAESHIQTSSAPRASPKTS